MGSSIQKRLPAGTAGGQLGEFKTQKHVCFAFLKCRETEPELAEISYAYTSERVAVLRRKANEGMDFAAHNTTLEWLTARGQLK